MRLRSDDRALRNLCAQLVLDAITSGTKDDEGWIMGRFSPHPTSRRYTARRYPNGMWTFQENVARVPCIQLPVDRSDWDPALGALAMQVEQCRALVPMSLVKHVGQLPNGNQLFSVRTWDEAEIEVDEVDQPPALSFENCCEVVGIDANAARSALKTSAKIKEARARIVEMIKAASAQKDGEVDERRSA